MRFCGIRLSQLASAIGSKFELIGVDNTDSVKHQYARHIPELLVRSCAHARTVVAFYAADCANLSTTRQLPGAAIGLRAYSLKDVFLLNIITVIDYTL